MFEGEGDKNKKGVSSLARCMGQEEYTLSLIILHDKSHYCSFPTISRTFPDSCLL